MGNNDYDSVQKCAGVVYEQLTQLKTIKHPKSGKEIKIVRQSCGDGKERRSSTGNSSAKSSYPIPEAPEHHSQLGDMKLSCLLTLGNFKDAIMETAHKQNKQNSLLFSGGQNGPISKQQYQKQVIQQQFANEVFELTSRESTPQKSSSTKAERKRQAVNEKKIGTKKVVIIINQ